jgi:hypothetical protein
VKRFAQALADDLGASSLLPSSGVQCPLFRCDPIAPYSNDKKKGEKNRKNGNRYLARAFAEAGDRLGEPQ